MKRLLVIMLLLLGLSSCGNRKETVAETIDNLSTVVAQQDTSSVALSTPVEETINTYTGTIAEILIDKYSTEIKGDVIALANKLEAPAEHVYSVLVKQQIINSIAILFCFILSAASIYLIHKYKVINDNRDQYGSASDLYDALEIIEIVLIFVFVLGTIIITPILFQGIFNPEYGAIKEIGKFFSNLNY